jgi:hypothetical protein
MKSFLRISTLLYLVVILATALFATAAHADQQGEDSKWNQGSRDKSGRRLQGSSVHDVITTSQKGVGRLLKKTPKTKKPKQAKSKSPIKPSCYTAAQFKDFVTALINAFSSGATSVTLVICDGNTIKIPEPININLDTPQNSRRILQGGAAMMLSISSASSIGAGLVYTGTKDLSSLISFTSVSTASALSVTLNGINMSSSTSTVAYFFDVSNLNSSLLFGSVKVGKNIGTLFLHNKKPVQAVCCDSCSVPT